MNRIKVSTNFSLHEFQCTGAGQVHNHVMLDENLLQKLQQLRTAIGRPIIINSAFRCPQRNAQVGGSPNSQHMLGTAVDIRVNGMTPRQVAAEAEKIGFGGIGIYNTFTHLDTRAGRARWNG